MKTNKEPYFSILSSLILWLSLIDSSLAEAAGQWAGMSAENLSGLNSSEFKNLTSGASPKPGFCLLEAFKSSEPEPIN